MKRSSPAQNRAPKQGQAISSVGSQVTHHRVHHNPSHGSCSNRVQSAGGGGDQRQLAAAGPPYSEERPGTPTVDEPGIGPPGYQDFGDRSPAGLHHGATTLPPMHQPVMVCHKYLDVRVNLQFRLT